MLVAHAVRRDAGARGRRAPVDRRRHLVGMAQDGLAAFEPAFVDELAVIMRWAFDYLQRDGEGTPDARTWLRDATGGSVYLRLSTRPRGAAGAHDDPGAGAATSSMAATGCGRPGPNAEVVVAYTGVRRARGGRRRRPASPRTRRDVGLLAITSADRLNAGWTAAQRARERGTPRARATSSGCSRRCRATRHRHRLRRPPGDARLARRGRRPPRRARSGSSISARPDGSPTSTATTASTPPASSPPRRRSPPAARSPPRRQGPERRPVGRWRGAAFTPQSPLRAIRGASAEARPRSDRL